MTYIQIHWWLHTNARWLFRAAMHFIFILIILCIVILIWGANKVVVVVEC